MCSYDCWCQSKQNHRYPRSASKMLFVWFGELFLQHVSFLVSASIKSVQLRFRDYRFVFSFDLNKGSVHSITIRPCFYLDCVVLGSACSLDLLRYHQRMSRPAAADEGTSNSQRPECRLRRYGSQYMRQAYSGQWWWAQKKTSGV